MADYKSDYSNNSSKYVSQDINNSQIDKQRYIRSKNREAKYNNDWCKQKVNLNDIVNQFAPNSIGQRDGVKFKYVGTKYTVKADMPCGYIRIMENKTKQYIKLDGTYGSDADTHYKIKRRGEM